MSLEFPWAAFMEAQNQKKQNQQQFNQNIAGMGQALGGGLEAFGKAAQEQKKKQILDQLVKAVREKGQAIPGPQGYAPPGAGPNAIPSGQPIDNSGQIQALMMQYDPQEAIKEQMKQQGGSPWTVVPSMLVNGKPVQENKRTGQLRPGAFEVTPTGRGNAAFGANAVTWENASEEDKNIAKSLYESRIRAWDLGPRDRTVGVKLANEYAIKSGLAPYKSYAGNVAGKTAETFASGKLGQNALSLNTALGHVNSAYEAFQQINNTDQRWLNRPLNKLRAETKDPNVMKLGVTLNALRGELATTFKGSGGTDQEIASWRDYLTDDLTPEQVNAVVPQIDDLLRSRLSALDYQRSSGMSGRGEMPLLSPHGAEISKKFGDKKPLGVPKGVITKVLNGKTYIKTPKGWFEQ